LWDPSHALPLRPPGSPRGEEVPADLGKIAAGSNQRLVLISLDVLVVLASAVGAMTLRFDGVVPAELQPTLIAFVALAIPVKITTLAWFKLYRLNRRFVGTYDLLNVVRACLTAAVALGTASFLALRSPALPRSVLVMDLILSGIGFGGIRAASRASRAVRGSRRAGGRTVLVVGAGSAGASLIRDIKDFSSHRMTVVGVVDDDPAKGGTYLHGVKVLGDRRSIPRIVASRQVDEVLIAMPSASGNVIQETVAVVRKTEVGTLRIVPDLDAVLSGRITTANIRPLRVDDLLNRTPPALDSDSLAALLGGKTVLVTGAAGSIGSELSRHLARLPIGRLVMFDQNESGIFDLEREIRGLAENLIVDGVIGDVRNELDVRRVFELRPWVVFHAAAYKHVPLMELHPHEAIRTTTFGTWTVDT
jgi:FlaA1/EpsC-like NDP-sugar epimerase